LGSDERGPFLDDSSQHDSALRADVESILFHCDRSMDFLETPAISQESARAAFLDDVPDEETLVADRRLGRYRLVRQSPPGMGTVCCRAPMTSTKNRRQAHQTRDGHQ
jgi:hypothetical protein